MRRVSLVFCVAFALLVAACGGGGSSSAKTTESTTPAGGTVHVAKVATADPSASAKMVCATEAVNEINTVLSENAKVSTPTWVDHIYSCDYVYPEGKMGLHVKELSSTEETDAYYNSLAQKYGKKQDLQGLGQGAFVTKNGNVVVRKDYKVLLIDVSGLPKNFAGDTSENDAINVAATIMGCWTGA
jgi:hypothetical protein